MKTILLSMVFFTALAQASEIVDVHNQIPMMNDAPRIKDYYLSTDGANFKKDMVVKIVRTISISQGKKNIGDVKVEIGQLRILAVADKVAVAREYKLFPKDQAPLTENIGFMVGDQVDMSGNFIDNSKRKPSDESAHVESVAPAAPATPETAEVHATPVPAPIAPAAPAVREPSAESPAVVNPEMHSEVAPDKIEVKIFPDKI